MYKFKHAELKKNVGRQLSFHKKTRFNISCRLIMQSLNSYMEFNDFKSWVEIRVSIRLIVFLFLHENICCGYSLEAPRQGASNEYPQHMFSWRNKKNINTFGLKKAP